MRLKKISGFILSSRPAGDYDRWLSVFSTEYGLVDVLAKGVRRFRSQRSFHLDLLNRVQMELEECGQGEKCRSFLREVSSLDSYAALKKQPPAFSAACLVAGFLLRILPTGSPQPKLFELTQKILAALSANPDNGWQSLLLVYFLKSLRELGHLPHTMQKDELRSILWKTLQELDPQFTRQARLTFGIFSSFESTRSS